MKFCSCGECLEIEDSGLYQYDTRLKKPKVNSMTTIERLSLGDEESEDKSLHLLLEILEEVRRCYEPYLLRELAIMTLTLGEPRHPSKWHSMTFLDSGTHYYVIGCC